MRCDGRRFEYWVASVTAWLPAQIVYALVAWYFASRVVYRVFYVGGLLGADLASMIRELREAGRAADVLKLSEALGQTPLTSLLEVNADRVSAEELVAR